MKKLFFLIFILFSLLASATHNLGGYISYRHISGTTYEIKVIMYTDVNSQANIRKEIEIDWGDNGARDSIFVDTEEVSGDLVKRVFIAQHSYPGPGSYTVSVQDPNRTAGLNNINNSVYVPFYLETQLRVFPVGNVFNSSPEIASDLILNVQTGTEFCFNVTAHDHEGDFLLYELTETRGNGGLTAQGYTFPDSISIDPINGELNWKPMTPGFHAVTIKISECRNDILISYTLVDVLLSTYPGTFTEMSFLQAPTWPKDTLGRIVFQIAPGDTLDLNIQVISGAPGLAVDLIDNGTDATIRPKPPTNPDDNKLFQWITDTSDLRCAPYLFTFRGSHNEQFSQDLSILVYLRDSNLMNCDTICGQNVISVEEISTNQTSLKISVAPNPFSIQTKVEILSDRSYRNLRMKLYTIDGKLAELIEQTSSNQFLLNRGKLISGIYFYQIEHSASILGSGKIIVANH